MRKRHRRHFLKEGIAAGVGFWVAGSTMRTWSPAQGANEQIQFACIGLGGKGAEDTSDAGLHGKVVAICDVDDRTLDQSALRNKDAKKFFDFREMLSEMGDKIDAVTVSVPDHSHAVAALMAMRMGKHCFCQKPLTHSVFEARLMGQVAREMGLKTQMGNQGTARNDLRQSAAVLKSGALGNIRSVHVWTNRPVWPQGLERPKETPPVPEYLHWNEWLGPAPYRPYNPAYHPFKWRGFWDFGTGALGDMACHTFNMPFMGLDLRDPKTIEAESSGHNKETYPGWSIIKFEFPARGPRGPVAFTWYDGGKRPDESLLKPEYVEWVRSQHPDATDIDEFISSGSLIIGDKGVMFAPGDYADQHKLFGLDEPKVDFVESPGHFTEWAMAITDGGEAMSNFPNYASPLTETILLGNLSLWNGSKIEWDAQNLKVKGQPELDSLIKREYRDGYSLDMVPASTST